MNNQDIEAVYPATLNQTAFLLSHRSRIDQGRYIEQMSVTLTGSFDRSVFERAWEILISRHGILRTAIAWSVRDTPVQVVYQTAQTPLKWIDWQKLSDDEVRSSFEKLKEEETTRLSTAIPPPLMTLVMVQRSDTSHELLWTHHHAILDGWSQVKLLDEFLSMLDRLSAGEEPHQNPVPSFGEFALHQSQRPMDEARRFWLEALKDLRPAPSMPHDERANGFRELEIAVPQPVIDNLTLAAQGFRVTLGVLLHALWGWTLAGRLEIHDLCFGSTFSGRPEDYPQVAEILGPFATTHPCRIQLEHPERNLADWLRDLHRRLSRYRHHAFLTPGQLHEILDYPTDRTLFDTVLVLTNYPQEGNEGRRVTAGKILSRGGRTRYALALTILDDADGIVLRMIYDRAKLGDVDAMNLASAMKDGMQRFLQLQDGRIGDVVPDACFNAEETHPQPEAAATPAHFPDLDPRGELYRLIAEATGGNLSGQDGSFWGLGGNSLLALGLLSKIQQHFGIDLTLRDIIQAPTVESLVDSLAAKYGIAKQTEPPLKPIPAPDAAHEPFPLTELQAAYLAGRQGRFLLGEVDPRIYFEFELRDVDLERLGGVINQLIIRHPMLRALFENGQQRVLSDCPSYKIEVLDLSLRSESVEQELAALRAEKSCLRTDPSVWPLFEIFAVKFAPGHFRLFCSIDLLVGDARSWQILMREIDILYRAPETRLPDLRLSFRDYMLARRQALSSERYRQAKAYWTNRLSGLPEAPKLPYNLARLGPEQQFERRRLLLTSKECRTIETFAKDIRLTLTGFFTAVFAEILARYTEESAFTLNLTLQNRPLNIPGISEIVGDFTSLLLLEIQAGNGTFLENAKRLQKQLWDDLEQTSFDGVTVMRELRNQGRGPSEVLMPVVVTSTLGLGEYSRNWSNPFETEVVYTIGQTPQVLLDYQIYRRSNGIEVVWDAIEAAFQPQVLDRMFTDHTAALRQITHNDSGRCPDRIFDDSGIRSCVDPVRPDSAALMHLPFFLHARRQPDALAVVDKNRRLTYGALAREAETLARRLASTSDGTGTVVVFLETGWEYAVSVMAVLRTGRFWAPISPSWPDARVETVLRKMKDDLVVITTKALANRLAFDSAYDRITVVALDDPPAPGSLEAALPEIGTETTPDQLAYVIHTSGTTGTPKGAMISHSAAMNTILEINERFSVSPADRVLCLSSSVFDLSVYDVVGTLSAGAAVVFPGAAGRLDPSVLVRWIHQENVTIWNSVPVLMALVVEYLSSDWSQVRTLRLAMLSGDWLNIEVVRDIKQHTAMTVVSLGGATEAAIWSIAYEIEAMDPNWTSIPYGKPLRGQSVVVLDEALRPRPTWIPGELYIGGAGVAMGYLNDPEQTALHFVELPGVQGRFYRTFDWCRLLPDGNYEFLGRRDDQVKIRGYRIELQEVESALAKAPGVKSGCVVAVGQRDNRELTAFYVGSSLPSDVRTDLMSNLPEYMVPNSIRALAALPVNANQKIDRKRLAELAETPESIEATTADDRTDQITTLVRQVIGGDGLSPNQDLFSAGMNSVAMIRIFNQLEHSFHKRPDLEAFFRNPTIAWLSATLSDTQSQAPAPDALKKTDESPWDSFEMISDVTPREQFKAKGPRTIGNHLKRNEEQRILSLETYSRKAFRLRRSYRTFDSALIPHNTFSRFLHCLAFVPIDNQQRRLYPSSGGLYALSSFVHVRHGRIEGIPGGIYAYCPDAHDIVPLMPGVDLDVSIHYGATNQQIAKTSAFSLFLAIDPGDIVPMYGQQAYELTHIDAGYMGQLLSSAAIENGLGLCAIGRIRFEHIRHLFPRSDRIQLIHTLIGGTPLRMPP